jgi:hypothetical protein
MTSKIEEVAKAIYHGQPRNKPWGALPIEFQRQYHKLARVAIEAMREPPAEYMKRYPPYTLWPEGGDWSPPNDWYPPNFVRSATWKQMISAALEEKP